MVSKAANIPNYKVVEEGKRHELEVCVAALKSSDVWRKFEARYRDLYASAEPAGVRKPPLEELLGLGEPEKGTAALGQKELSHLASEDQQETEIAAELEKGS